MVIAALWLGTSLGGCHATQNVEAGDTPIGMRPLCESPAQAGCAECCVEQPGPAAGEKICNRRTAARSRGPGEEDHEYAEQAEFRNFGPCPASCRTCATCTRDRRRSYQELLAKGCDCLDPFVREAARGIDPCYSAGCGCICSLLAQLGECGPPV
jgi:hypothetical protein